jgi:hypothetical protein
VCIDQLAQYQVIEQVQARRLAYVVEQIRRGSALAATAHNPDVYAMSFFLFISPNKLFQGILNS